MDTKSKIILISGPTASGKSKFAIEVAKKIKGEIINADSMQVYRELSILTARPKKKRSKKYKTLSLWFSNCKKKLFYRKLAKVSKKKNQGNTKKEQSTYFSWWYRSLL